MKIIAATGNAGKVREIKAILGDLGIEVISQKEAGIDIDVEETGTTFLENAFLKARAVYEISGLPAIADDSGLCVDALNGAPGVYSARYAGENATDADRIAKLLSELENIENRSAHFTSAVAFVISDTEEYSAEGHVFGHILRETNGEGGFGYDPIFYSDDLKKSFGTATAEEKNTVSHRYRALMGLKDILKEKL
ncbi:MAG: XTP/dITP diphosphatase [Clostridia bacterium]|nr:XTP/dITP diphosphatase [Clostridia bacterium]